MPWPIEADRATQEHYAREHRRRERLTRLRRRKSVAAWLLSFMLHLAAIGSLVRAAGLEPTAPTLEVFTAELATENPTPVQPTRTRSVVRRPAPRSARASRPKAPVAARPRATPAPKALAVRAPQSVPPVSAPPAEKPDTQPRGSEPFAVASAPLAPAEAMSLTPARTLTAIEPPPAVSPPATPVVAQAQTDQAAATPDAPQAGPPMAAEPVPAQEPPSTAPEMVPTEAPRPTPPPPAPAVPPAPPAPAPRQPTTPPQPRSPAAPTPVPPAPRPPASGTAVAEAATEPDRSPTEPARDDLEAAKARASSPLGLGLGRLRIQIDGARARTTERAVETISGTLVGGADDRVTVRIGDTVTELADGRRFSTSVSLKPGVNHVRLVAADGRGNEVEETVSIDYTAPVRLTITEPRDGHTLTADDPPLVVVQGTVDDVAVSSVWIAAGERRVAVPVVAGRFRHTVPVLEPTVQVRVEAPAGEGRAPATAAVTVHAAGTAPAVALLLHWPHGGTVPAAVTGAWRPRPDRAEGMQRVTLQTAEGDARPDFFYLSNPRPGVYTFVLSYHPGAAGSVEPALYIAAGGRQVRKLNPVPLNGSGRAVVARVLMPQGVLWEDEDWFTGRSANGDGVTKFRFPDGISWTERTGGAAR